MLRSITTSPLLKKNIISSSNRSPLRLSTISGFKTQRFASQWAKQNQKQTAGTTGDKIDFKWFLLVGVFGTMVYITVMQRLQEQDHSKNMEKYKKTFTEAEWSNYVNDIQKKHYTLENGEECYFFPFTNNNSKIITQTIDNLGGAENVGVMDLNELISKQINSSDGKAKYHILLSQTLDSEDPQSPGFKFKFNYKLKPGIFTQIANDEIVRMKAENPSIGRFLLLNCPPNIKEAIKFEQNVTNKDTLLVLNDEFKDSDVIQYFDTVDKVIDISKMKKLEPLIIDSATQSEMKLQREAEKLSEPPAILKTLPTEEPASDSPAIIKAQYKLRQLNEPIRIYGESDVDVIKRLNALQK